VIATDILLPDINDNPVLVNSNSTPVRVPGMFIHWLYNYKYIYLWYTILETTTTTVTILETTTTTVIYPVGKVFFIFIRIKKTLIIFFSGGKSPGLPAQLGMGLGISLIGVLLIAEIIFLYWKFGLSNSPRREEYAMWWLIIDHFSILLYF